MDGMPLPLVDTHPQRHERALQALHRIAQAINTTMPVDALMTLIYTQVQQALDAPCFTVTLSDSSGVSLSYVFTLGETKDSYPNAPSPVTAGLTGEVMRTGAVIRTDDCAKACADRGIEPSGVPIRAWLGAPLITGDRITGVMAVYSEQPDVRFFQDDERFLSAVAAMTASSIARRQLEEQAAAHDRNLQTLNEMSRLVASSLNIDEVLDSVVHSAVKLLDAEVSVLWLLDEDTGELVLSASCAAPGALRLGDALAGLRIPADDGFASRILSENTPVILNDLITDRQESADSDEASGSVAHSVLAVPLNARGRTLGVLEVKAGREKQPFNRESAGLLLAYGAQAALAIDNARRFTTTDRALQARVDELTTLQTIDRMLNSSLDYVAVMAMTLEWATRLTGATVGLVAALYEAEDGSRGLRILAHCGYPPQTMEPYMGLDLWPLERGLIGAAVRSGQTILVQDVHAEVRYEALAPGMRAQLTLPIQRENRVTGVIALEAADGDLFSPSAVDFVSRFAEHAAIAIDNARLFQQVQHANEAKTDFVSFVSHELKQPMTAMKGYADLLTKGLAGPLTDQQRQFIGIIRSNIEHMDRLVQDLLEVSRLESGRLRLDRQPIEPSALIQKALQSFDQLLKDKHQTLTVEIQPALPTLNGDRGRLTQVLNNLLSNAIAYTPEQGTVAVLADSVEIDSRLHVRIQVRDSGIGMTPEELEKLFTKYFRSSHPVVRSVRGTGLGLAITRSLVELHEGRISVASEPEEGSTFTVLLPVR